MTNAELKTRFLIGYEFIANNLAPGYTDAEISGFLNQGMDLLVDQLYSQGDIANIAELLEKQSYLVNIAVQGTNPEDYGLCSYWTDRTSSFTNLRWFINARVKIRRTEPSPINDELIECELINKLLADKWTQTSINKPIIIYPKLIFHGISYGFVVLIDSYSTITDSRVLITYLRTPTRIDTTDGLTCELHPKLHQKIVDKAIQLAMKATDAQRAEGEIKLNQAI